MPKFGLITRVFAENGEDADKRVKQLQLLVANASRISFKNKPIFARIDIEVWADNRYSLSDYGGTFEITQKALPVAKRISVNKFSAGDHYCALLNNAVARQFNSGIDYSLIVSSDCAPIITQLTMMRVTEALGPKRFRKQVRSLGIAFGDLCSGVKRGLISNTAAVWHNESLLTVGGFSFAAALPQGENHEDQLVAAGAEEIIPLIYLQRTFGPCIGWISSKAQRLSPQNAKWDLVKITNRLQRQQRHARSIGATLDELAQGVIYADY